MEIFQSYDHKCTATFFMVHSVYTFIRLWKSLFTVGAERGAERVATRNPKIGWSGAAERSGERGSGRCRITIERSGGCGAWSGGSRSRNGAGSGGYRIRLERGAAFSPAPLRL